MCCLKIIFLAVNASNLIKKKDTIGKEIEKRNKQNLFISQGLLLLKNDNYSKTAKYLKTEFSLTSRERRRAMT